MNILLLAWGVGMGASPVTESPIAGWTLEEERGEFTLPDNRPEFTLPRHRPEFTLEKR